MIRRHLAHQPPITREMRSHDPPRSPDRRIGSSTTTPTTQRRVNNKMIHTSTVLSCQLLGMNCRTATEFALSWPDFCQRGGGTDIHADG